MLVAASKSFGQLWDYPMPDSYQLHLRQIERAKMEDQKTNFSEQSTGKFWMVLGYSMPVYRHESRKSAITEAERLARQYPGTEFTVLESLASVVKSDITWKSHDTDGSATSMSVPF